MAISLPATRRHPAEMNVTPLIDVLLVLLIIFMLIAPTMSNGLEAVIPQPPDHKASAAIEPVILSVERNGIIRLNQEEIALDTLAERLRAIFARTPNQAVFVRAGKDLDFGQIAEVIDAAKGAGADRVALMTQ